METSRGVDLESFLAEEEKKLAEEAHS